MKNAVAKVGPSPKDTEDVTIKKGVLYIGKYPAQNFETGEDIKINRNPTYEEVYKALHDNGAVGRKIKVFRI